LQTTDLTLLTETKSFQTHKYTYNPTKQCAGRCRSTFDRRQQLSVFTRSAIA